MFRIKSKWEDIIKRIKSVQPNHILIPRDQEFINQSTKIKYICKKHGQKMARPGNLLKGQSCPDCAFERKKENLIKRIKSVQPDHIIITKDFSNFNTKIKYICKKHGQKITLVSNLLKGKNCPDCAFENNWLDIIKKIESKNPKIKVPRNQEYKSQKTKIKIICKDHGEHMAIPDSLIHSKHGCPKCAKENTAQKLKNNWLDVIKKIESIHENITVPIDQKYINAGTKIKYICKHHGENMAIPFTLMNGIGCKKCGAEYRGENLKSNWSDVIKKIESKLSNITVPPDQEYINSNTKIKIICEDHGEHMNTPNNLFNSIYGCPECVGEHQLWSRNDWPIACRKANGIPIVYWLKMTYENENWYKFGITYNGVKRRFSGYEKRYGITYEIIKEVTGEPEYIWDLERRLHIFYSRSSFLPPVEFPGETECYKIVNPLPDKLK